MSVIWQAMQADSRIDGAAIELQAHLQHMAWVSELLAAEAAPVDPVAVASYFGLTTKLAQDRLKVLLLSI